jgi:hypothetical protein
MYERHDSCMRDMTHTHTHVTDDPSVLKLVMAFAPDGSLRDLLDADPATPLPPPQQLEFSLQVIQTSIKKETWQKRPFILSKETSYLSKEISFPSKETFYLIKRDLISIKRDLTSIKRDLVQATKRDLNEARYMFHITYTMNIYFARHISGMPGHEACTRKRCSAHNTHTHTHNGSPQRLM